MDGELRIILQLSNVEIGECLGLISILGVFFLIDHEISKYKIYLIVAVLIMPIKQLKFLNSFN